MASANWKKQVKVTSTLTSNSLVLLQPTAQNRSRSFQVWKLIPFCHYSKLDKKKGQGHFKVITVHFVHQSLDFNITSTASGHLRTSLVHRTARMLMVPNKQSFPWKESQALYLCSDGVGVTEVSRSYKSHVTVSAYPIKFPNRGPNNNHRSAHTQWNFHMVGLTFTLSAHTPWNSQTGGVTVTMCVPSLWVHTPWNSQTGGVTVTMCVPSLWVHTPWNSQTGGITVTMCVSSLSAHPPWNSQTGGVTVTMCVPSLWAHPPWNSQTGGVTVTMCVSSLWVHTPWNSQTGGVTETMCVPSLSAHTPWNSQTGGLTITMCVPSLSAHPPWNSHSARPQTVCSWACRGRRGPQWCWLLLAGRSSSGIRWVCRDWKSNCWDQAPSGHSPGEEREEIYM